MTEFPINTINTLSVDAVRKHIIPRGNPLPLEKLQSDLEIPPYRLHLPLETNTTINGRQIGEIEDRMRKQHNPFLSQNEHLLPILEHDNDSIERFQVTHKDIATPLYLCKKTVDLSGDNNNFTFNGHAFTVEGIEWMGEIYSPFFDDVETTQEITVVKDNTQTFTFSHLQAYMIAAYGFYEGPAVIHRIEPQTVIDFFNLKSK